MKIKNILAVALAFSTIFSLGVSVPAKADTLLKEGETEISCTVPANYTLTVPGETTIKSVSEPIYLGESGSNNTNTTNLTVNSSDNNPYLVTIKPYTVDENGEASEEFKLNSKDKSIDYKLNVDSKEWKKGDKIECITNGGNTNLPPTRDISVTISEEDWAKAPVGTYEGIIVFSATGIKLASTPATT